MNRDASLSLADAAGTRLVERHGGGHQGRSAGSENLPALLARGGKGLDSRPSNTHGLDRSRNRVAPGSGSGGRGRDGRCRDAWALGVAKGWTAGQEMTMLKRPHREEGVGSGGSDTRQSSTIPPPWLQPP